MIDNEKRKAKMLVLERSCILSLPGPVPVPVPSPASSMIKTRHKVLRAVVHVHGKIALHLRSSIRYIY